MSAQALFDEQLVEYSPITDETVEWLITNDRLADGSSSHESYLAHIGEKKVFYIVCDRDTSTWKFGDPPFNVELLSCWESDINTLLLNLELTHDYVGSSNDSKLPKFIAKPETIKHEST